MCHVIYYKKKIKAQLLSKFISLTHFLSRNIHNLNLSRPCNKLCQKLSNSQVFVRPVSHSDQWMIAVHRMDEEVSTRQNHIPVGGPVGGHKDQTLCLCHKFELHPEGVGKKASCLIFTQHLPQLDWLACLAQNETAQGTGMVLRRTKKQPIKITDQ